MPYPPHLLVPMREELTRLGVEELHTAEDVDALFASLDGDDDATALLIVNSVCGCAAANARPAIALSRQAPVQPDRYVTVFAGQDLDATARARQHLVGIPPSSPSIFLLKGGEPVLAVERRHIEGRTASAIAMDLVQAFNTHCEGEGPESPDAAAGPRQEAGFPGTFRSIL
ncbi:MAG: BrxA/BrxB family bacilliredoxin [Bacteroidota bacterium]